MRRGANLALSQWFAHINAPSQWRQAACVDYQHLPWTHDTTPCTRDVLAMKAVCDQCPLLRRCAARALRERVGGFYAGVWLPWPVQHETDIAKMNRHRARRHLREVLRGN